MAAIRAFLVAGANPVDDPAVPTPGFNIKRCWVCGAALASGLAAFLGGFLGCGPAAASAGGLETHFTDGSIPGLARGWSQTGGCCPAGLGMMERKRTYALFRIARTQLEKLCMQCRVETNPIAEFDLM